MLRWRLFAGVCLVAGLSGLLRLDYLGTPGVWLLPLALVVGLGGAHEMIGLLERGGYRPLAGVVYGGTLLVIAANAIPLFLLPAADDQPTERLGWPLVAFTLVTMAAVVGEMSRYRQSQGAILHAALGVLGVAYVGLLLTFAVQLRVLGGPVTGMVFLITLVVVVKLADTGAYTVGRLFGRHKMAPVLSPNKTIEGAVAALVFACLGAWFSLTYLPQWMGCNPLERRLGWLVFGLAVGIAGILGDLAESLLKRDMGAKDSGDWLPGFGGVLDLVDSILFAAPVAYLCALFEIT